MKKLFEVFKVLDSQQKKNFYWVSFYKLLEAILEVISIGSIYPLIYLIFNDDLSFFEDLDLINFENKTDLFMLVLSVLIFVFSIKALFFVFSCYKSNTFLVNLTSNIQIKLLQKYLGQDFNFFLNKKNEKLLNNIIAESVQFSKGQVAPLYVLINETIKIFFIFVIIFFINPLYTAISILVFAPILIIFIKKVKKELDILGVIRQQNSEYMIAFATKGLNSIREILLFKNQKLFLDKFEEHCKNLHSTSLQNNLWQEIPKILLEFLVVFYILSIFIVSFKFSFYTFEESFIFLSFLSISFVRLLPSTNLIIKSIQVLSYYRNVTGIIKKSFKLKDKIKLTNENKKTIDFKNLEIKNLSYSFNNKILFNNLNLKIKSNQIYGVNGSSGSGKTTLFNLLIGFLEPKKGNIYIDGKSLNSIKDLWQNSLCYIPQDLYLLEDTIEKNITLSDDKSDKSKLNKSITVSKLNTLITSYSEKIKHVIKNQGIDLSGGQRQRIGIARSIYMNRNIVFLDETTNALDSITEHKILSQLRNSLKNKTIFVISHNKNLNKYVDKIITIKEKKVTIKDTRH
tara:strand:+ start:936 stop:2642 length:1707 start_codon:yes stop_codon:yes gene_type:complete